MKLIYWLSYILPAPFFALSWVCYGSAWLLSWLGGTIHDATTYKAWLVLHRRECAKK